MPSPAATAVANTGLAYSPERHIEQLCDGSFVMAYQSASDTISLKRITNPSGTPTFTALTQTFALAGSGNTVADLFVVNNGTTTSDVWVAYGDNSGNTSLISVAHATFTASGATWSWDNTGASLASIVGSAGFFTPSIIWNGTDLIVAFRAQTANWGVAYTYTTTKNGSSNWQTLVEVETLGGTSHCFPQLLHDATNGCALMVYAMSGDTIYARVLVDGVTPTLTNWSAHVALTGTIGVGAANLAATLDTANQRLHVIYNDSASSNNPHYVVSTYTTTSISAGTPFNVTTAANTASGVGIGLDSAGLIFLFWSTGALGSAADVSYATLASPYASGNLSSITNLTNGTSTDNALPHVPTCAPISTSYVPLLYAHAVSPWTIEYDNSITISALIAGSAALAGNATLAATAQIITPATAATPVVGNATLSAAARVTAPATTTPLVAQSTLTANAAILTIPTAPMVATGVLAATTGTVLHFTAEADSVLTVTGVIVSAPAVSAPLVSTGAIFASTVRYTAQADSALTISGVILRAAPASTPIVSNEALVTRSVPLVSSGVMTAISVVAGTGIGGLAVTTQTQSWSNIPGNPGPGTEFDVAYTDAVGSGWQVGLIPTYGGMPISSWYEVDARTVGLNQTALATTIADGRIHVLEQAENATFSGSEDQPFGMTELAPAGTDFRRYYQCSFGPDANGFNWVGTACIYPGDPGFVAYRFDCINPSGSAIALAGSDGLEMALIGGMQQADGTWAYTNGGYGTLAGSDITPWPVASGPGNLVSADPDYVYILPASGGSTVIGQVTVKQKPVTSYAPAWSNPQLAVLANTGRMKIKLQGDISSFPANTTSTFYLLMVMRRNLNATDARSFAADYLNPGTPTTTIGSFTGYSYDERAYVFAAVNNQLSATLDLSPAHVTARWKPIYHVTGWTAGAPLLLWNGVALTPNVDYRFTVDTANQILYYQLYFDVVAAGAIAPQRNNASLVVQAQATQGSATVVGVSGLVVRGTTTVVVNAGAAALGANATLNAPSHLLALATPLESDTTLVPIAAVGTATLPLVSAATLALTTPQPLASDATLAATPTIIAGVIAGTAVLLGQSAIAAHATVRASSSIALVGQSAASFVTPAIVVVVPSTPTPATLAASSALSATGFVGSDTAANSALSATGAVVQAAVGALALAGASAVVGGAVTFIASPGADALAANATLTVTGVVLITGAGGQDALAAQSALTLATTFVEEATTLGAQSALTASVAQVRAAPLTLNAVSALTAALPATVIVDVDETSVVSNGGLSAAGILIIGGAVDQLPVNSVVAMTGAQIEAVASSPLAGATVVATPTGATVDVAIGGDVVSGQSVVTTTGAPTLLIVAATAVQLRASSVMTQTVATLVETTSLLVGASTLTSTIATQGAGSVPLTSASALASAATVASATTLATTSALTISAPEVAAQETLVATSSLTITGVILTAAPTPLAATTVEQVTHAHLTVAPQVAALNANATLLASALLITTSLNAALLVGAARAAATAQVVAEVADLLGVGALTEQTAQIEVVASLAANAALAHGTVIVLAAALLASEGILNATPQNYAGVAFVVGVVTSRTAQAVLQARSARATLTSRDATANVLTLP